jgi:DNA-binding protein H-NS
VCRVRKKYGKILAERRLERNYSYFYKIRYDLMVAAQCKIAFVWRMNRIKIKLARKKREKEEAAKKKAANQKGKYYHYAGSGVKAQNSTVSKTGMNSSNVKGKTGAGASATKTPTTPAAAQAGKKPPGSIKAVAVGSLM